LLLLEQVQERASLLQPQVLVLLLALLPLGRPESVQLQQQE
jgi:hypothetical protein